MKTVLMVPDIFAGEGGIARIMRLYLKALCDLAEADDEVGYVSLNDRPGDELRADRYANARLRQRVSSDRQKLRFIGAFLWHGVGSDRVVCGHLHHLVVVWFLGLLRPGMPYYLVAHGIEMWRPYGLLEKLSLRGARRVFCISEYTRRQMLRFDPKLNPERLVILPNTFAPWFSTPPADWTVTKPGFSPRILVVSRLVATDPYKGVDLMIEAMPAIIGQFPGAMLRIVGGGDDEPRLRRLAMSLAVESVVHFTGIIDDAALRSEYAACDIFALPSRKEGFGLVYLEAMTYGKPCIAARAGGAPEVVGDYFQKAEDTCFVPIKQDYPGRSRGRRADPPSLLRSYGEASDGGRKPDSKPASQEATERTEMDTPAQVSGFKSQVSTTPGPTSVGCLVEYGSTDQIALAVADLVRHPRDPAAMQRRAEQYSFPAFKQRLATMLRT